VNWHQLRTVLWLRWRLTRNQWAKSGGLGGVLAAIIVALGVTVAISGFAAGLLAGLFVLDDAPPTIFMVVWLAATAAFLFMWVIGLITELQRSETIDLPRLLHLPVRLGQIFVVNYLASHGSVAVVVFVSAATGLSIGLAISRGPAMLLMLPLALGMVFMVTAWTYLLRGWLATIMSNPRRRRAIIMGITAAFIVIAQAPNIYFNVFRRMDRPKGETREQRQEREAREEAELRKLVDWQVALPPLWVPVGAKALAEGRALPAVLGTLGVWLIGAAGLRRAYVSTLRFYHGETGGRASARPKARAPVAGAAPASGPPSASASGPAEVSGFATGSTPGPADHRQPRAAPEHAGALFLERQLPRVPEQAAAVALMTFRSMLRAPEIKMQWGTSFLVTLLVGAPLLFRSSGDLPAWAGPFIATAVVVFSMFLLVSFVANQFGFDRDGFRAFVLSPADRRLILLGKNLAAFPVAALSSAILVSVVSFWLSLPFLVFVASLLQLAVGVLATAIGGNLLSILVPYRIQPGSMKPTKLPAMAMVLLVISQVSMPLIMSPAFIPPLAGLLSERMGGPPAVLVNFLLSLALAAAVAFAYWRSLGPIGRLLHRREMKILETVSVDVE
jgi:ABC-2 type transport system permease protein